MLPCPTFAELQAHQTPGVDFRIQVRRGRSGIVVMAIHGGGIEPGTTEIADAVAGESHAFYSLSGLKPDGNAELHISSRKFDEPEGVGLVRLAWTVVTIHGCRDRKAMTYLGGRHRQLKLAVKQALAAAGFPAADAMRFPGVNPKNICNKGRSGMGLQLEVSLGMRQLLFDDLTRLRRKRVTPRFSAYVLALRTGINSVCPDCPP